MNAGLQGSKVHPGEESDFDQAYFFKPYGGVKSLQAN